MNIFKRNKKPKVMYALAKQPTGRLTLEEGKTYTFEGDRFRPYLHGVRVWKSLEDVSTIYQGLPCAKLEVLSKISELSGNSYVSSFTVTEILTNTMKSHYGNFTEYDKLGRVVASSINGEITTYEYDGDSFRVTRTVFPDGSEVTCMYDENGNLIGQGHDGKMWWTLKIS